MAGALLGRRAVRSRLAGVLATELRDDEAVWRELTESVARATSGLSADAKRAVRDLLYPDLFSEFDARFLSEELRELDLEFSPRFWECERSWATDEELHYKGFRAAYAGAFDRTAPDLDREMRERRAAVSFAPIAELFEDEFAIACLMAYDELATVRAYRANAEGYRRLGPQMEFFVARVTADEGRHYRNFFKLIVDEHSARIPEFDRVIERVRAAEGITYGNTFVLDHDDDVWSDEIFDESAAVLRRHLHA